MFTRHASRHLTAYVDDQLATADRQAVETHVAECAQCRTELEDIRFAARLVRQLSVAAAPGSIWTSVERTLIGPVPTQARPFGVAVLRWAAAALVAVLAVGGTAYWYSTRMPGASWEVHLDESGGTTRLAAGEWIQTGTSRVRITVGDIGTVDVEPGTRVRLGAALPAEYRIALARGTISALIAAPPRLFFVETPASTVVDLGCAYTMHVDEGGAGELLVTQGWASLEWGGRESLVPAGARGRTRPGVGPGTPYFEDAPLPLQEALAAFDFASGGSAALGIVLSESRVRDTLTLWHLLSRVDRVARARVYDRIAELTPPPATVSREKALQLDAATLKHWREELAWTW